MIPKRAYKTLLHEKYSSDNKKINQLLEVVKNSPKYSFKCLLNCKLTKQQQGILWNSLDSYYLKLALTLKKIIIRNCIVNDFWQRGINSELYYTSRLNGQKLWEEYLNELEILYEVTK